MAETAFYDPARSYYENYEEGPFGSFADGTVIERAGPPSDSFLGMPVYTRFGIPAGPLLNGAFVKAALDKGFDLPVHKTIRTHFLKSHDAPNVLPADLPGDLTPEMADTGITTKNTYSAPLSITNSFGNPSYAPDVWQPDLADAVAYAKEGQIVGGSFEGRRWDGYSDADFENDWVEGAKLLQETGVGFIEANFSCPNEGTTALLCYDIEKVAHLSSKIKDAVGDLPLFLKISYYTDDAQLAKLVEAVGDIADGFAVLNSISAEVRTPSGEQALPGEGRLRSGICGAAIKWAGIDMIARLAAEREKQHKTYALIGVGGVTEPANYGEYRDAGADAVMSATGAMWHPELAEDIYNKYAT